MSSGEPGDRPRRTDPFAADDDDPAPRGPSRPGVPADGSTEPGDDAPDEQDHGGVMGFLRELPVLLLIAFGLAFLLRTFVIQVFFIPSSSMENTLEINDRIVVEKITYRFRDPERGEIIVFEGDELPSPDNGAVGRVIRNIGQFIGLVPVNAQDFVKRVIGVPGDDIEIRDGRVYVNDVVLDEPYVDFDDLRSSGPFEVPAGSLFVLGDNRPNSSDSRFGLGYVDIDDVVGRAFVTIWPFDRAGLHSTPDYGDVPEADPPEPEPEPSTASATEDG